MASNTTWTVRAGKGAFLAEEFLEKRIFYLLGGFARTGDR
jgi:hypothetical protein